MLTWWQVPLSFRMNLTNWSIISLFHLFSNQESVPLLSTSYILILLAIWKEIRTALRVYNSVQLHYLISLRRGVARERTCGTKPSQYFNNQRFSTDKWWVTFLWYRDSLYYMSNIIFPYAPLWYSECHLDFAFAILHQHSDVIVVGSNTDLCQIFETWLN